MSEREIEIDWERFYDSKYRGEIDYFTLVQLSVDENFAEANFRASQAFILEMMSRASENSDWNPESEGIERIAQQTINHYCEENPSFDYCSGHPPIDFFIGMASAIHQNLVWYLAENGHELHSLSQRVNDIFTNYEKKDTEL